MSKHNKTSIKARFPAKALTSFYLVTGGLLTGCGGVGQDVGEAETYDRIISGVVVDGYVARSKVYVDYDNNASRDPWEPYAFTDDSGYYSYNPLTGTDYCAADANPAQTMYCLRLNRPTDGAVIRADGGYDLLTGEPFYGQLSRRVSLKESTSGQDLVVSPLTTLFTDVDDIVQSQVLQLSLGLDSDDLDVDYLNVDGNGTVDPALFNSAVKVHKVVSILANNLNQHYDEVGETANVPGDLTTTVYRNLAKGLTNHTMSLESALAEQEFLYATMLSTEVEVRDLYELRDLEFPEHLQSGPGSLSFNRISQVASRVAPVVDRLIPPSGAFLDNISGRARALEAVVIKSLNEKEITDPTIDQAMEFFTGGDQQLVDALVMALNTDSADLSNLALNDFAGDDFDSDEDIYHASQLPVDAEAFTQIAGMEMHVSDLDLGSAPSNLKDVEVKVFFKGAGGYSGDFDACVKYIDGASIDGSLGEANTRGELVSGSWSLLGAELNGSSYSLLLTIDFLGSTFQAIMKPSGNEIVDNTEYKKIRFDYAGDIRSWHSEQGLVAYSALPTSNEDCVQQLPSRIDI